MDSKVSLQVRLLSDSIAVIDIAGEVTGNAETALAEAYNQIGSHLPTIILNFTQLEYMNSSGIGLMVTLLIRSRRHGQRLLAYGLTEHYQEIFELTRLNEVIVLYPSEAATLAAINSAV